MTHWTKRFSCFDQLQDQRLYAELMQIQPLHFGRGTILFREGDACKGYVLVLSGSVCVNKMDDEGREILLYRVQKDQSCMLTTTCLMGQQNYPAEGVVEQDIELVMLTSDLFNRLMASSEQFRRFAMQSIGQRVVDMMRLLEHVAFARMDDRVAHVLLKRLPDESRDISCTHQALAVELGSAREVVSRILKRFESQGLIQLSRGNIRILDQSGLKRIASSLVCD